MSVKNGNLPVVSLIVVVALVWIFTLVDGVRLIRLQEQLVESVERGDFREVLSILEELDPDGTGTVTDWTGVEGEDQAGFVWLLAQWRKFEHIEGAVPFFERWVEAAPSFSRSELSRHLDWLRHRDELDVFRDLFVVMLEIDLQLSLETPSLDRLDWLSVASGDLDLVLMAWVRHYESGVTRAFPERLISEAVSPKNLASEGALDRVLKVTGLLEPVSEFRALKCPWKPERGYGATWVEWFEKKVFSPHAPERRSVRLELEENYFPNAGPDTPGMFLLKCFAEPSARQDWNEIFVSSVAPGLEPFKALPEESKEDVAGLLARHVVTFRDETDLREWVWLNYRATWKSRESDYQNTRPLKGGSHWTTPGFRTWIYTAARLGHAEEALPTIRTLWAQQLDLLSGEKVSMRSNLLYGNHPYSLAKFSQSGLSLRSGGGGRLNREGYQLMLATARQLDMPPCIRLAGADEMSILDEEGKTPWDSASVEDVCKLLNELGESFAEDPLRFLIVSSFCDGLRLFKTPEDLARFQILAAEDESPGGWLVDDLADLLPLHLMMSDVQRRSLLKAGGRVTTLVGFNQYLQDDRAPVAARITFALTALPWWYTDEARRMHAERMPDLVIAEPNLDQSTLDFAQNLVDGTWPAEVLSADAWSKLIEDWLDPFQRDNSGAEARTEARRLLLHYFESVSEREIASARVAAEAGDESGLGRATELLEVYAKLLRVEGRGAELVVLANELDGVIDDPKLVFPWIRRETVEWDRVVERLAAEEVLYDFRSSRGGAEVEKREAPGTSAEYAAMAEATATLEGAEWMQFCSKVLDQVEGERGAASSGASFFHTLLPRKMVIDAKDIDDKDRAKWFLGKAAKLPEITTHKEFFALAFPPLVRQILKEREVAERFLKELGENKEVAIEPGTRTELEAAARTMVSIHHGRYLGSLVDPGLPLAQRWLAANYLLIARRSFGSLSSNPSDSWDEQDRVLVETALDLLIEAVDRRLPIREIADRGLGDYDAESHQKAVVLSAFRDLLRNDPDGQAQRAAALLSQNRLDAMLAGHGKRFLAVLHNIAVYAENRAAADSLFSRASVDLEFNKQIQWLSLCRDWRGLAGFLPGQLANLDSLGVGDFLDPPPDALPQILSGLPEGNRELELLARVLVTPRWKIDPLMNPSMKVLPDHLREVGERFVGHQFTSPEIERFVLNHAPIRLGDFPQLGPWVEGKITGREWLDVLKSDSQSFGKEWPYWAKYLEVLADSGKFDLLVEMLPNPAWFAGNQQPAPVLEIASAESREEMVWMGFARSLAGALCFGSDQARLDAAMIAAKLLKSPPALSEGRTHKSIYQSAAESNRRRWSFDYAALEQLSAFGTAALLVATLDEPLEIALERSDICTLPTEPLVLGDHRIDAGSYESFFSAVADLAMALDEAKKEKLYLRALETKYFKRDDYASSYPCASIAGQLYHPAVSNELLKHLAGIRLKASPDDASAIGDYGLMLSRDGKEEALPFLERSLAALDEKDLDKRDLRSFLMDAIERVREKE